MRPPTRDSLRAAARPASLLGVLLVLAGVSAPGVAQDGDVLDDFLADPTLGGRLHFTYRIRYDAKLYRFRDYRFNFPNNITADDQNAADELEDRHRGNSDQDIDQFISIRTHDLITPWIESGWYDGLDTDVSVRVFNDIDGTPRGNESLSTYDNFKGQEAFQLRTFNARVRLLDEHLEVTAGRQYIDAAEWVHIDGGHVRLRGVLAPLDGALEFIAFGGQRVTFFSSIQDDDAFKNDVWGGTIVYRPARDTEIEISDVHYIDNSLRARVLQRIDLESGALVNVALIYRQINEDPESITLDTVLDRSDWKLDLRATYVGKFGEDVDDFDFDYTFSDRVDRSDRSHNRHLNIGDLEPYDELTLELRKGFGDATGEVGLFAGGTGHWIRDRSDRDVYNTDWYEVWGGIDSLHLPWEGLTGRLTVRYVYTDLPRRRSYVDTDPLFIADVVGDGEPEFVGAEILLEQQFARRLAVGTTANWRLYEYESRFAKVSNLWALSATAYARWRQSRILSYYLGYTYERDYKFVNPDFEEVHGLRAQMMVSW